MCYFFKPKKDLRFCLKFRTKKASLPGMSLRFTPGVSLKPLPLIQTLENFFRAWETPLTAPRTVFFFRNINFRDFTVGRIRLSGIGGIESLNNSFFLGVTCKSSCTASGGLNSFKKYYRWAGCLFVFVRAVTILKPC